MDGFVLNSYPFSDFVVSVPFLFIRFLLVSKWQNRMAVFSLITYGIPSGQGNLRWGSCSLGVLPVATKQSLRGKRGTTGRVRAYRTRPARRLLQFHLGQRYVRSDDGEGHSTPDVDSMYIQSYKD
jgi:hypothetical protein